VSPALIGNIVTNSITHQATTLQVTLGLILREKSMRSQLHKFGVIFSHDEVLRFNASRLELIRYMTQI